MPQSGVTRSLVALCFGVALLWGCAGVPPTAPPRTAAAPPASIRTPAAVDDPTAPATGPAEPTTPDAEAELQRSIEVRTEWGLRSDEAWVRSLAEDPSARMSELGILVTADEAAQLAEMFEQDPITRLSAYGVRNWQQFGGLYIDPPGGQRVVLLFTGDLERHREALGGVAPPGLAFDVRLVRFTEHELRAVQDEIVAALRDSPSVEFVSAGVDTIDNVVEVTAKSSDPTLEQRLEGQYGGMLDTEIVPLSGAWANVEAGDGWRLLAHGMTQRGEEAYRVRAATDPVEWQEMWQTLDPVNPPPEIDFESEIAVSFGHGIGSACPEVRLDDVVIDHEQRVVYSVTSDPLAPRGCTADLVGAVFFVVALSRDALPGSPFTLRLGEEEMAIPESQLEISLEP